MGKVEVGEDKNKEQPVDEVEDEDEGEGYKGQQGGEDDKGGGSG